jgi:hypothetical protein
MMYLHRKTVQPQPVRNSSPIGFAGLEKHQKTHQNPAVALPDRMIAMWDPIDFPAYSLAAEPL